MEQMIRRLLAPLALVLAILAGGVRAADTILVVRPAGQNFEEARKGMAEMLGSGWFLADIVVSRDTRSTEIVQRCRTMRPKAVVLMDNHSVALYKDAATALGDTSTPVVALMGVRIDLAVEGVRKSVGIAYEIPAVTSMVNLRAIVRGSVRRVGVVYRASWEGFFRRQAEYCAAENIELVGRAVPDDADPASGLRKALGELLDDGGIDVLWVLNDNFFLTPRIIQSVWGPMTRRSRILTVVGVEPLVNPALDFGSFAVLPDHYALGSQAAGILEDMQERAWAVDTPKVEQPLSVLKILNARQVKGRGGFRPDRAGEIDRIME